MKKLSEIFYIYTGSKLDYGKQEIDENGINFVSRNSNNNGVVGRIALKPKMKIYKKGDITVPLGGSYLLSAFVQDEDFVTAQNVDVLRPKKEMTDIEKWFYCYVLRENRFKFSAFGREVNKYIQDIEVPDKIPTWVYGCSLSLPKTQNNNPIKLDYNKWKKFIVGDIFDCKTTKPLDINEAIEGNIPYITRSAINNGNSGYYGNVDYVKEGNCITIGAEGRIAFYQKNSFIPGVKVYTLKNKYINEYNALFIITLLNQKVDLYNYGRARILDKIKEESIYLPVDEANNPDWNYMERYIRSLPYADLINK